MRWKAPQPVRQWEGIKQTTEFAPACSQLENAFTTVPGQATSEDCLYLNVWSPAQSADDNIPVLVWIHGGGFSFGSTAQPIFNGIELAKKGVVFVSLAYRVGPLGFMAHPALSQESPQETSGNYGLLDQIEALKWVKKNIGKFGGNDQNITIMGESAGGISVSMLAASPLAKGLFNKAIAESGASFGTVSKEGDEGSNVKPLANAEAMGKRFADSLGATTCDDLRSLPVDVILSKMPKVSELVLESSWPVLDGYVIAGDPVSLYQSGKHNDTPILIGSNAAEGSLFFQSASTESYKTYVESRFGEYSENILKAFPAGSDEQALESQQNLFRDLVFSWHSWTWSKLQSQYGSGKVYAYYFNHTPPKLPGMPEFGPTHAAELPYVFNLLPPPRQWTANDYKLADQMSSYWTNFAKTGNPNSDDLPHWPNWTSDNPQVMHFSQTPELGEVANTEQLEAIEGYFSAKRQH